MSYQVVKKTIRDYWKSKNKVGNEDRIPVSGKVIGVDDILSVIDSVMDGWFTEGRFSDKFEKELREFLGIDYCVLVNSGSSANLLALSALTSRELGDKRLKKGDEVITLAASFPTTVNPIIQNNLIPVFVDINPNTYNIDDTLLKKALSKKTKAVMIAHTLGNPFNVDVVKKFCNKHKLWLIEDCCDALGAKYKNIYVGNFGDVATYSFYPAHQITMGEGGAVVTSNALLYKLIKSYRDWGRDCWCKTGCDNTCNKRFGWKLGKLPYGYDHKYIYSHIGYNLKTTDLQAALGLSQLKKLPKFIKLRRRNFEILYKFFSSYNNFFILPEKLNEAQPSWFGFLLTVKKDSPFNRSQIVDYLENQNISTRVLFAGNLLKHPAYEEINHRVIGKLKHTDFCMENTFWLGVYPGINRRMLNKVIIVVKEFLDKYI